MAQKIQSEVSTEQAGVQNCIRNAVAGYGVDRSKMNADKIREIRKRNSDLTGFSGSEIEELESRLAVDDPNNTYKQPTISMMGRQFKSANKFTSGLIDVSGFDPDEINYLLATGEIEEVGL